MSVDTQDNAPASTTTSSGERLAGKNLSEQVFLDRELQRTSAAVAETLSELKESLREGLDLRVWTERRPWVAVGVAAASGFVAAAALRSKGHAPTGNSNGAAPAIPPTQAAAVQASVNGAAKQDHPILKGLFDLAKVALEASIMAAGKAAVAANQPPVNEAPPPGNL